MSKKKKNIKLNIPLGKGSASKEKAPELFDMGDEAVQGPRKLNFKQNVRTLRDCFAPSEIDLIDKKTLKVGEHYIRNYVMQGYPTTAYVGWLDSLYDYDGNLDTAILVEPSNDREAIEELTKQITATQAQYAKEANEGKVANLVAYQTKIDNLTRQRAQIEQNVESMFNVGIFANLSADSQEELEKRAEILESELKGQRMNLLPTNYRMLNGFKTALPLNVNFFKDKLRNFNTGSLVACLPFTRGELCHPNGVYLGMNMSTGNNVMMDFYNKKMMKNTNMAVFGRAGSGKSFFVTLLSLRSALKGVFTTIIDPEGEYDKIARMAGGINITLSSDSKEMINPFDIDYEVDVDDNGVPTGKEFVNLEEKYGDLLDLLCVMAGDVSAEERSLMSDVLKTLYASFGITEDVDSLYDKSIMVDPVTGEMYPKGKMKRMPQFSDFYNVLNNYIANIQRVNPTSAEIYPLQRMANKLKIFCRGQAYGLFDCQSTVDLTNFALIPILNFDVSKLEEGKMRPIGMYIVMTHIWNKIVKKNYDISKRVVCDEAWMMMNPSYEGHEYTSAFLEKCARRIRKRNAGLCVASQGFTEFSSSAQGQAVLTNLAVKMFLKQSPTDIDALQQKFKISDGEKQFLITAKTGQMLIRTDTDAVKCMVHAFPFEVQMIEQSRVH